MGNEIADEIAKFSSDCCLADKQQFSQSECRRSADKYFQARWMQHWCVSDVDRCLFQIQPDPIIYTKMSQKMATFAACAKIGHIPSSDYLSDSTW